MKLKYIFPVLLLFIVSKAVTAQIEDELPLPDEKDNQFPPDNLSQADDDDNIEGSGSSISSQTFATEITDSVIEAVEQTEESITTQSESNAVTCPDACTCSIVANDFIVNCANKELKEFPLNIDSVTTILNLQNNEITEIPKYVNELKNLVILNVSSNSITDLKPGIVSELQQLKVLDLANNRLLKYPLELNNAISLTNLEELYLSDNDIRETLTVDNFSNFKKIRRVAIPSAGTDITNILCDAFKNTLQAACYGSCNEHAVECENSPDNIGEEYLAATLPGTIAVSNVLLEMDTAELDETFDANSESISDNEPKSSDDTIATTTSTDSSIPEESSTPVDHVANDFSFRTAIKKGESLDTASIAMSSAILNAPTVDTPLETEIKVGETQSAAKEGVDKSVIGMVVAGMVVVIAGITIKKNWSSIRKRLSSSPRPASGTNSNGTMPEEVPLQDKDKSPV